MYHPSSTHTRLSRRTLLAPMLAAGALAAVAPWPALARAPRSAPDAQATSAELFQELDTLVTRRMSELQVPGVALGLVVAGEEHTAVFGVTSVDNPLPVDTDTLFQIGSTTKTFTGTAVMHLMEQGQLDLETPVRTYLPDFRIADPDVSRAVRPRHLVTHTAGWFDRSFEETGDGDDALALFVGRMADLPQISRLGKYFSYSNTAFSLAGHVVEAVAGEPYEEAVNDLVLKPLGMEQSAFFPEKIMTRAFAVGHGLPPDDPAGAPVVLEPWALPRAMNPAGGLAASVNDLLRYARFHLGDESVNGSAVLSSAGVRRMQEPLGPGGSVPGLPGIRLEKMGMSWMLWSRGGSRIVSHSGGTIGQQSAFTLVPERGFAASVLTNSQSGVLLAAEVTDWVLERFLGLRSSAPTVIVGRARLAEYAGEYAMPDGSQTIRIEEDDGTLHIEVHGIGLPEVDLPLRVVGDDVVSAEFPWEGAKLPILTDFVRDDTGQVRWIRFLGRLVPRTN